MIPWVVENGLKQQPNRYTLENLALGLEKTGAAPVFMLNMLSKGLDHSLRNLKRAEALGMPVRYVEMSNELYFDIPFPKLRYPTPEAYGDTCQTWIETLSAYFPEAHFAVVGSYLDRHDRQRNWTRRVLSRCPSADAVTYHQYTPSGLDGRQVGRNEQPGLEGTGNPHTATRRGPTDRRAHQQWERELLNDPRAFANVLTTAAHGADGYHKIDAPEGMDIWATEFNMRDDNSVVLGSWAQALLLSVYYGNFYDSPVKITSIHNLVGKLFGLIHVSPDELDHLVDRPRTVTPFALSAAGIVTSLFARTSGDAPTCRTLEYRTADQLTDDRGEQLAGVRGWLYEGADQRALLVNYQNKAVTVAVPQQLRRANRTSYTAPLDRSISGWEDLDVDSDRLLGVSVVLPPNSITRLE